MSEDIERLDGNAAAGSLSRFFAWEVTNMGVKCGSCGTESPMAKLHLYGGRMGIILRCVTCGAENLRAMEIGETLRLDARGSACLTFRPGSGSLR